MNPSAPATFDCDCGIDTGIDSTGSTSIWWRIGISSFLAMNAMVLGVAVNGSETTPAERSALELSILCVSFSVLILLVKEFAVATWSTLRQGRLGIEVLFLIGILASYGASALSLSTGAGGTFADVAALLLVIYSLGRQIASYGKARVFKSLADWAPERRLTRLLLPNGETESRPASRILAGDRFRVLPGEAVPVDARILAGTASFQQASLTGEALAVTKAPGDSLSAGVYALDASVDCLALAPGQESSIDQIRTLVLSALAIPGKEQMLALAVLRYFVPAILLCATATFLLHWQSQGWQQALFHSLSVVVIACPCALGFATPLAVWTAIARLREIGILARSGDAVERLAEIDTIVFDKTGTLTLPDQYQVSWQVAPAWEARQAELRGLLQAAESLSRHPLARALAPLWEAAAVLQAPPVSSLRILPGLGMEATFATGQQLFIGHTQSTHNLELTIDGQPAAEITLVESTNPSAASAIQALEAAGLQVILSTGDAPERAAAIPISQRYSRQSPLDKHELLSHLQAQGHKVLFVGDGLNDIAAMAWSRVAFTVSSSPDVVRELSSLLMIHADWQRLPEAIAIARAARQLIRTNIIFSLVYNTAGMALALAGILHPVAAALIMLASSLTVILYSMHLMDAEITLQAAEPV
jgi:heavy metal translocating P-type ATPase